MLDALQNAFFQTGDTLTSWLSAFSSFLWGWPLLIMLLGTHLYLTAILRFPQRYLLKALKLYFVKDHTDKGDISPFSSLMVALAANIGAGNIIGVGVAIAAGGPGAVFWCWLTGVLGMATRYSEGLLAIKYRVENKDGNMSGGPMFVLERGLNSKWLGTAFAVFTAMAAFGIGNLTQGNAAAEQLHHAFSIPSWGTAAVLTALTALVMLGGIQGIARVCAFFVPFMAVIYILGCLYILTVQAEYIFPAIRYILDCAFTGEAAAGGAAGAAVMAAMRTGVARGLFSNEAGLGTGSIAHACADTKKPVKQGMFGIFEVFADTIVICTLTALVILCSGTSVSYGAAAGAELTISGFTTTYGGWASIFTAVALCCFAFSTIIGWGLYGSRFLVFLCKSNKVARPFFVVYALVAILGATMDLGLLWSIADTFNGLMSIPNLIALLLLSGTVVQMTRAFFESEG